MQFRTAYAGCTKNDLTTSESIFMSKGDIQSAFRIILGHPQNWPWTILKAQHLRTGKTFYWVNKNLPFGASILCSSFQHFSNCIKHLVEAFMGCPHSCTNYLEDYLYVADSREAANFLVSTFIQIANKIGFTVAQEKTEWVATRMVFLGILIVGNHRLVAVPDDKHLKALNWAKLMSQRRKATIHELQQFTGYLNFLCKAIYPGRAFTRRMYAKIEWLDSKENRLKQYHHMSLDPEFRKDCQVWISFLEPCMDISICCPFVDFSRDRIATELDFFTDSSFIGFGRYFREHWFLANGNQDL